MEAKASTIFCRIFFDLLFLILITAFHGRPVLLRLQHPHDTVFDDAKAGILADIVLSAQPEALLLGIRVIVIAHDNNGEHPRLGDSPQAAHKLRKREVRERIV